MRLSDVLPVDVPWPDGADRIEVSAVTSSSQDVVPGAMFVAVPGTRTEGAAYIPDAIAAGAQVIVTGPTTRAGVPDGVTVIEVANPRRTLAMLAARFYAAQPEVALAVTGTSGKTSVVDFTRQLLSLAGRKAASLGTLGIVKPDGATYGALTTPDPVTMHATLKALAVEGVTHIAFEASSHGLDQHRLDGVTLTAAAFTNLGRDHMDYHATVDDYFAAKMRLFQNLLKPGQTAVINADGARSDDVIETAKKRKLNVLSVGRAGHDIRLTGVDRDGFAQVLSLDVQGRAMTVRLPLIGAYQVENVLVAAGLCVAAGEDAGVIVDAIAKLEGVPGRLQIAGEHNGGLVIIDYAHKPEALAAALDACRPFVSGRLISVFGCGGDRDAGKRPIMGQISNDKADVTIITDDNPRSENPAQIRQAILSGAKNAQEIGDRGAAITAAITMIQPGDVVLIAGKGHETGQIVGDNVLPFSDIEAARDAMQQRSAS